MSEIMKGARSAIAEMVEPYTKGGLLTPEEIGILSNLLFAQECGNISPQERARLESLKTKGQNYSEPKAA